MANKLFYREIKDQKKYKEASKKLSLSLNLTNLQFWTKTKTINLYSKDYDYEYLVFRFKIINDWIKTQDSDELDFLNKLNKLIKVLCLENHLNGYEKKYIINLKNKTFTNNRNLKSLIVDFELKPKEVVYFHYRKIKLTLPEKKNIPNIDLYISNQRIIVTYQNETLSFVLNSITKFYFSSNSLYFFYHDQKYLFNINNTEVLQLSFKRLFKEIKGQFQYEQSKYL
ncbi:MAG: hypothetical protein ACRC4M_05805 [Mycoplasma sp.]